MKTLTVLLLLASFPAVAADPPKDAPTRDLDAPGRAMQLEAGNIVPFKAVCLDEQEDVSRERDRVRAHSDASDWKKIAIGSISAGAAVTVALAVLGGLAAAHKF